MLLQFVFIEPDDFLLGEAGHLQNIGASLRADTDGNAGDAILQYNRVFLLEARLDLGQIAKFYALLTGRS